MEVKLTRLYGEPVTKAVVHYREALRGCKVREGEVYLSLDRPALFTVDINGQMEDQDTGRLPNTGGFYEGPPIHPPPSSPTQHSPSPPCLTPECTRSPLARRSH